MLQEKVEFQKARAHELDEILSLLRESKLPEAGVKEHLENFFVARIKNELVGVCGLEIYGESALLRSVCVVQEYQGQGIAKQLITKAMTQAISLGAAYMYLLTTTARRYFLTLGFEVITRDDLPIALNSSRELQGACPATATVMKKTLISSNLP